VSGERFSLPVNDEEEFFIALNAFIGGPRAHQDLDLTMDLTDAHTRIDPTPAVTNTMLTRLRSQKHPYTVKTFISFWQYQHVLQAMDMRFGWLVPIAWIYIYIHTFNERSRTT
jgi:hypothetical protein